MGVAKYLRAISDLRLFFSFLLFAGEIGRDGEAMLNEPQDKKPPGLCVERGVQWVQPGDGLGGEQHVGVAGRVALGKEGSGP